MITKIIIKGIMKVINHFKGISTEDKIILYYRTKKTLARYRNESNLRKTIIRQKGQFVNRGTD